MKMTILRALERLEMDVDLCYKTEVANIERDSDQYVTLYGSQADGELYYIVLDQEVIERLKTI